MATTTAAPAIRKLEEAVVNKIAAGEVIQRPASALKELLENSIDAGATQIVVTVKEGGNKLLQITDNGHGIRKGDLPILCYRHTTSKLKSFEELETIGTLGFRGEALCSVSFVSHMTVTTMTADEPHGWKVIFKDSEMQAPGPKPVASVRGTTISVEDMFYNVPTRKRALKSSTEEYNRIIDIMQRYAVFKTGVAFSCKRQGEARTDLTTLASASRLDNIRTVFGPSVAKDLIALNIKEGEEVSNKLGPEDGMGFALEAYISSANYAAKKSILVLFINERVVECAPLKRAIEATYASVLPKASHPFLFMDLRLPPRQVEVNVHPTKREVGFLHQDDVIEAIRLAVEKRLLSSNTTRTFTQMQLPFANLVSDAPHSMKVEGSATQQAGGTQQPPAAAPHKFVRTDHRTQTLDTFLANPYKAAAVAGTVARKRGTGDRPLPMDMSGADVDLLECDSLAPSGTQVDRSVRPRRHGPLNQSRSELSSVVELMSSVDDAQHDGMTELMRNHTLVGMADDTMVLLQHQTKLYLVDAHELSKDLFYQQVLRNFEHFDRFALSAAVSVEELALMALDMEEAVGRWEPSSMASKEDTAALLAGLLIDKAPLLKDCVSVEIDEEGFLTHLPVLLEGYRPDLGRLPSLVLALGRDVEWEEEKECFKTIAQVLADFYAVQAPLLEEDPPSVTAAAATAAVTTESQLLMSEGGLGQDTGRAEASKEALPEAPLPLLVAVPAGPSVEAPLPLLVAVPAGPSVEAPLPLLVAAPAGAESTETLRQLAEDERGVGQDAAAGGAEESGRAAEVQLQPTVPAVQLHPRVPDLGTKAEPVSERMECDELEPMETGRGGISGTGGTADGGSVPLEVPEGGLVPASLAAVQEEDEEEVECPLSPAADDGQTGGVSTQVVASGLKPELKREWAVKHVVFPALKSLLCPSRVRATDGSCVQVAALERLYRIFERC